jgi:hypothetical protein
VGVSALTSATGLATLGNLRFTAGASGTYGLLVTASGYDAGVPVLLQLTNPINATRVLAAAIEAPLHAYEDADQINRAHGGVLHHPGMPETNAEQLAKGGGHL